MVFLRNLAVFRISIFPWGSPQPWKKKTNTKKALQLQQKTEENKEDKEHETYKTNRTYRFKQKNKETLNINMKSFF